MLKKPGMPSRAIPGLGPEKAGQIAPHAEFMGNSYSFATGIFYNLFNPLKHGQIRERFAPPGAKGGGPAEEVDFFFIASGLKVRSS